ncbi:MAG: hypothetical protein Tsb0033_25620 [Winogradskyella sp.]
MDKKRKIIQFFEQYDDLYQPYLPPIMEALSIEEGFDVSIYATKGKSRSKVKVLPGYYLKGFYKYFYLKGFKYSLNYEILYFLKQNPDIIHLQHSFLFNKFLKLFQLPKRERPKLVITLRGADTYLRPWRKEKWKHFYKDYGNKVDAFITVSEHQKKYLTKWGVQRDRVHVIPISFGDASKALPKVSIGDTINLVSAHRMTWEKNIEGNLRTVKVLKEKGVNLMYHIYGDGPDTAQIFYLIDKYGINDIVTYHGKVKNSQFKAELKSYDIFLQLSHSESFGLTVVEAQAMGLPAIISNSDGIPETIIDGKTGYCFNPWDVELAANTIIRLKNDTALFNSMSRAAISNANKKFTYEVEVEKLIKLYNSLL